ncbi:MAG: hypothetical protein PVI43_06475 [Candidatus Bathyarchaeota archaeon]|jgi:hypothetical protein
MGKKIGSIDPKMKRKFKTKKFKKKHPLAYVDSKGHAYAVPVKRHKGGKVKKGRVPKRKHVKLGGTKVDEKHLKARKALKKVIYVTKAGSIMLGKSGLKSKKRRKKARKGAKRSRKGKLTKKQRRKRAGKRAWKTRVRKYGKSGCKRGRRKTKPRRCRRKPGRKTAARRRRRRR